MLRNESALLEEPEAKAENDDTQEFEQNCTATPLQCTFRIQIYRSRSN